MMHPCQPREPTRLANERRRGALGHRPRFLIATVMHVPVDLQSPALRRRRRIAKARERDADLYDVTRVGHASLRLPDEVGAQIVLAGRDVRAVGLHAERVDDEHERAIALVEGVEVDLDVVIGGDAVAVGERGGDRSARLEGADAEVDRVRRIPHADFGRVGRRTLIDRLVEREAGEQRGARPDRLVEPPVDVDVGLDARHGDADAAFAPIVDGQRIAGPCDGRRWRRSGREREDREQRSNHARNDI